MDLFEREELAKWLFPYIGWGLFCVVHLARALLFGVHSYVHVYIYICIICRLVHTLGPLILANSQMAQTQKLEATPSHSSCSSQPSARRPTCLDDGASTPNEKEKVGTLICEPLNTVLLSAYPTREDWENAGFALVSPCMKMLIAIL